MSLIKCKECGKEVSTLAENCPNCGAPIEKEDIKTVGNTNIETEEVKTTAGSIKGNKKLMIGILILIIVLGVGAFFGVRAYKDKVAADSLKKYKSEIKQYNYDTLSLCAKCEKGCNLIKKV